MKTLDINKKATVKYCVPLWARDEHIRLALPRIKGRLEPQDRREDLIAVVGYGPSLKETWEKIREFPWVISCSGATRFLIDHGIIPNWHVEVDPREHKVALLGQPHPDVEYLLASCCHPKLFDVLDGHKVKLWHVFAREAESIRTLPPGEWAITGGCDVGLRCLTLARFMGFYKLHVFGLDGCYGEDTRHAGFHPHALLDGACEVEYQGKTYRTTPAMLEAAKQTCHELKQLPDVEATFYGTGLTQALVQERTKPNTRIVPVIGFVKPLLISSEYASLNARLHRENIAYGVGGERHASTLLKLVETLKTKDVLDYGCGKGRLAKALPFHIQEYDPAIPGKDESAKPADIVVCTDVLEHIEPDKLMFVLDDLRRCVRQIGYFTIHTGPAQKNLPDGRNTHLIQQGKEWWAKKLAQFFEVGKIIQVGVELHVIVGPRRKKQKQVPMSVVAEPKILQEAMA